MFLKHYLSCYTMGLLAELLSFALILQLSSAVAPIRILNDGNMIPAIGLGTAPNSTTRAEAAGPFRSYVLYAIEAGYRMFDTSLVYNTEEEVGQGIADAISEGLATRDEIFLVTKLELDSHGRDQVVPALRNSLKNLNLDYVDLYIIHFPFAATPDNQPLDIDYLETWRGMEEAQSLGLARSIGVSNFNSTQLARLIDNCNVVPAVNEVEVNPTYNNWDVVSYAQCQGITVIAYSPYGFLVPRTNSIYREGPEAPTYPPQFDDPALVKIANKYGKTTAQIVLWYLIEREVVPIPKSINKEHQAQNIDIFDFCLSQDEVDTISNFNRNEKVFNMPTWKDFLNYPFIPY